MNYCNACGIDFTDSESDCLNKIRLLELVRSALVSGQEETSAEVRDSQ